MEYCCHIWGGAPRSQGLDLLEVQKRVVNLVGPELSADLHALPHRRDVASLSLFYKYYYRKCSSDLADLVARKRVPVRSTRFSNQMHLHKSIYLSAGLIFMIQAFFLARQPFETLSLMNVFHQITISQHSKGGPINTCC